MAHKLDRFQTLRTLGIVAQSLKPVKLMSQQFPIATFFLLRDRRSVAQQCWIRWHNIVGATHAYYTWSLKSSRLYPFHDPLQEPTLLGVVTSVCIPLSTRAQQLPTLLAHNICWELLHPFAYHCQPNNVGSCCVRFQVALESREPPAQQTARQLTVLVLAP